MNRKFGSFVALLVLALGVSSTSFALPGIGFGPRLGLGLTKFSGSAVSNQGFGFGYSIGAALSADLVAGISLATELSFARKKYSSNVNNIESSSSVWDLSVPVLARYSAIPMLFVQGGLSFNYGLGSISSKTGTNPSVSTTYYNELTNPNGIKRFDLALVLGAGTNLELPTGSMIVDFRYGLGLLNRRGAPQNTVNTLSQKTHSLELAATYLF